MKWIFHLGLRASHPKGSVHGGVAAVALGAIGICWGTIALAAGDTPARSDGLGSVVEIRSQGNDEAAAVQKRIDSVSDETDELLGKYRSTLKQIDSIDLYNEQMRELLTAQMEEIASLQDQVSRVQGVGRSVMPLMQSMVTAIAEFVRLDVPFLIVERGERTAKLRELMGRADVTTAEKFRQIMEAYQIENEYGRTIEAYRDTLMLEGRETTVDLLRFGRIALLYQSLDENLRGRWDQASRSWVALDSDYRSAIRDGLRIARKQTAPDLVRLPLAAPLNAGEAG